MCRILAITLKIFFVLSCPGTPTCCSADLPYGPRGSVIVPHPPSFRRWLLFINLQVFWFSSAISGLLGVLLVNLHLVLLYNYHHFVDTLFVVKGISHTFL